MRPRPIFIFAAVVSPLAFTSLCESKETRQSQKCIRVHSKCKPDSEEARTEAAQEFYQVGETCYAKFAACEINKKHACEWTIKDPKSFKRCLAAEK